MADTPKPAIGQRYWRGYARTYIEGGEWFPEVRACEVVEVQPDGFVRLRLEGIIPGGERKRNPGYWTAWNVDPAGLSPDPIAAMKRAIDIARDANAAREQAGTP